MGAWWNGVCRSPINVFSWAFDLCSGLIIALVVSPTDRQISKCFHPADPLVSVTESKALGGIRIGFHPRLSYEYRLKTFDVLVMRDYIFTGTSINLLVRHGFTCNSARTSQLGDYGKGPYSQTLSLALEP